MSNRYGRNQKRAHLARIAELENLLYGGWARANSDYPTINGAFIRTKVIETDDARTGLDREAEVEVLSDDYAWPRRLMDASRCNWRGQAWIVTRGRYAHQGPHMIYEISLSAFAEPQPKRRGL